MKLELPDTVDQLRRLLISHRVKGRFFGGCIRDYLLLQVPNDYDMIAETNLHRLETFLLRRGYRVTKQSHSSHLFLTLSDNIEVQIMERLKVPYDFTINRFSAPLDTLDIQGARISFQDLEQGVLRAIDTSPRVLRRGLYMLYKYPHLQPTPGTLALFRKVPVQRDLIQSFLVKKNFPLSVFQGLCQQYRIVSFR